MSVRSGTQKGRNTRNSQRLFNLQQQEILYRKLGISAMPGNKSGGSNSHKQVLPKEEETPLEKPSDGEVNEEDPEPSDQDEGGQEKTPPSSKKTKNGKRTQSMSSDSESEKEKMVPKKKKKKKAALAARKLSNSYSPGAFSVTADVHRLGDGSLPHSNLQNRMGASASDPIVLPQSLMFSPTDSGVINAHMSAYTKFLMDNNLLIGQGNMTGLGGPTQGQTPLQRSQQGFGQQNFQPLNQQNLPLSSQIMQQNLASNSAANRGILDDSSLDGNSNADPLDFLPPPGTQASVSFLPQVLQQPAPAAPPIVANIVEEVLLSQHCEAEKEVDQIDDSAVGPEVPEQIMLMVQNFLGRSRKAAKIDDLALEFLRPKNMPFLKSPKIEEEIYLDLTGQAKHFDKNCRALQGYLNAGMTALMRCIQTLIQLEKLHPNITQAGIQAKKALQLMAFTNRDINDRRKDALKVAVNPDYLPLLKNAKPPSEDWLLGGSLGDLIKQVDESKKMSEKIMKNKKPSSGGLQDVHQGFQQNQFVANNGRPKYRNRQNKKDNRNQQNFNFSPRSSWVPHQQQQQQQNPWYQPQMQQDQLQLQYQQLLNQGYQAQQQQQQAAYPHHFAQHQQQLGFQQNQAPKNFQQPYQPFQQKKKN